MLKIGQDYSEFGHEKRCRVGNEDSYSYSRTNPKIVMQIKIFSSAIGHEAELEQAANRFMSRSDVEVIDVVFDQELVPRSAKDHDTYQGQSVVIVKYRTMSGKPLSPEEDSSAIYAE